jgi:hypothetical protein
MNRATYEVTLTVDGRHSVSVQSDEPAAVTEGLVWAQDTYKKLIRLAQSQQVKPSREAATTALESASYQRVDAETEAPICGVHGIPMIWQKGRKGYFWSCHEKNSDGSWCSYKPPTL